ncbi:MAG TPA: hypothetical protein VJ952_07855, partial [Opitutales bacterium]|nr:hypothetical protein [Opitutales bacterium]
GIPPHDPAKLERQIREAGIEPSVKVYDTLVKYRNLIPEDKAAFREFAKNWWGKQPSGEGYTTERNHAAYWESYDEKTAEKVRRTVQKMIDTYFPEGRPEAN